VGEMEVLEAEALCKLATQPGPWVWAQDDHGRCIVIDANGLWVADVGEAPEDARFIAEARTLVPKLIEEVRRLQCRMLETEREYGQRLAVFEPACDLCDAIRDDDRPSANYARDRMFAAVDEARKEHGRG